MRRKIWKIKELNPKAKELAQKHNISIFLAQILLNRGIEDNDFNSFLSPSPGDFHSPLLLPDINKAAARIEQAVKGSEKVLVFGDYDVDGITSLAVFHEFSKKFSNTFSFYIPHRIKEGYGLNREAILRAKEEGVNLILAFDCGTNAKEELELAHNLNIDVIVIDHHYPKEGLTNCFAFINPRRKNSSYPFADLSAAALSFKLLQVLTKSMCYEALDLVALSLVCDVAPLKGENRILLKEGLRVIKKSQRFSIKALCKVSSVKQENIDTFHMGYILGPRINASGRVAHSQHSLELFLTEDERKSHELANKLSEYNQLRRAIEVQILKEAESRIKDNINDDYAIVVSGKNWHAGVLGIVASRLTNKYYRPSFVISFDENVGRGSGRSIESVHLVEALDKCADSLLTYGGHKKAAGIEIRKDELENFKEKINSFIEENLEPRDFIPSIDIDAVLAFKDIDLKFTGDLEKLKPYGEGNKAPLFASYKVLKKSSPKKIKSGFFLWLSDSTRTFEGAIYDRDVLEVINYADVFDIVFSLERNHYHNTPKLTIRDCRFSDGNG